MPPPSANHLTVVKVRKMREMMQRANPSRNVLRNPSASVSDPTKTMDRVNPADQIMTARPVFWSLKPRSEVSQSDRVKFTSRYARLVRTTKANTTHSSRTAPNNTVNFPRKLLGPAGAAAFLWSVMVTPPERGS